MAKTSSRKIWLARSSMAAVTVAAASFSLVGFASATSWSDYDNSDSKKKYVSSYDWKNYSWDKDDKKSGYDYKKHGDKKYADNKHDYKSGWNKDDKKWDDKKDYGHEDKSYGYKHDDKKHDYKKDYGYSNKGNDHKQASYTSSDYGHDNDYSKDNNWSDNGSWDEWSPKNWQSSGKSYDEWRSGLMNHMQTHGDDHEWGNGGYGGNGDWSYNDSEEWGHDWNNWNPQTWSDNGYSMDQWHQRMSQYMKDHHSYWSSSWSDDNNDDYGYDKHDNSNGSGYHDYSKDSEDDDDDDNYGWAEKAGYHSDRGNYGSDSKGHYSNDDDEYCDNEDYGHDRGDNEKWSHDNKDWDRKDDKGWGASYDHKSDDDKNYGHGSDWDNKDHKDHGDNGDSYYSEDRSSESKYQLTNNTDVDVDNNVSQYARSGDASSEDNYGGGEASTGNASNVADTATVVTVDNTAANAGLGAGASSSERSYEQSYNGSDWDEEGDSYSSIVERTSDERTVNNTTNVAVNNNINQYAVSGDADSEDNYWGGTVQSGDATNTARTVSYVVVKN